LIKIKTTIKKEELKDYNPLLDEIKFLLNKAKTQAYKAVDNIRVQTYWQIGERIAREELKYSERADYGKMLVESLSKDIGFSSALLWRTIQFYRIYPILVTVSRELSWSHYEILITIKNKQERQFYESYIVINRCNVRELRRKIKEKIAKKYNKNKLIKLTPKSIALIPQDIFKNTYNFDFLDLKDNFKENDLKNALLNKFEDFIKELGSDFFIGRREVSILISGNYDKIDLELFHAGLMCYIIVEMKTEHFKHSYVSQTYSYLNWYKENKWKKGQRLPIGLIICKSKDEETVHYALGDLKKEIFVSDYKLKLPSEKDIIKKLK
jgi:predicted nuclease of restriction endonuclease-like (RecB) superfamily